MKKHFKTSAILIAIIGMLISTVANLEAFASAGSSYSPPSEHPLDRAKAHYRQLLTGEAESPDFTAVAEYYRSEGMAPSGEIMARFVGGTEEFYTYMVDTDFYGGSFDDSSKREEYRILAAIIRVHRDTGRAEVRSVVDPAMIEDWATR